MKFKFLTIVALASIVFTSCGNDSNTDDFMDGNPNAVARLITNITVVSAQSSDENRNITVSYDAANRVTSISDGIDSALLTYANDELANVASDGDNFSIEELYESPYDAFETGEVINYNSAGNPVNIRFYETEYDWYTNSEVTTEYRAEILYDNMPNPYFYTLQAAGAIEVMDNVEFNFSADMSAPEIVQASMLFPSKNIRKIIYTDVDGNLIADVTLDFVYNADNYPSSGSVTATEYDTEDGNITSIYALNYTYMAEN